MADENEVRTKQVCTMSIVLPIVTDDEAIAIKKKIEVVLENVTDAMIDFRIRKMPKNGPPMG